MQLDTFTGGIFDTNCFYLRDAGILIDAPQGAADWLCKACDEPDVALIQRQLLIGYNRAARLFAQAMTSAAQNIAEPT